MSVAAAEDMDKDEYEDADVMTPLPAAPIEKTGGEDAEELLREAGVDRSAVIACWGMASAGAMPSPHV